VSREQSHLNITLNDLWGAVDGWARTQLTTEPFEIVGETTSGFGAASAVSVNANMAARIAKIVIFKICPL